MKRPPAAGTSMCLDGGSRDRTFSHVSARAWLAFVALGITWGLPYLFIKIAVQEISPFDVAWGRITLAALILLPIAWRRGSLRGLAAHKAAIVAFGLLEFAIPFCTISMGERWIPSSVTAILIATVPLIIALVSRFFGVHERLGAMRLIGLAVGLGGVIALVGFGTLSGPLAWTGVGCVIVATVCYAIGALIIQRHLHAVDSIGPIAVSLSVASALLLIPALLSLPRRMPGTAALSSVAILGLVCTALSMLMMFYLVKNAGASRASIVTYINPAVATLLGMGLLDEHLGAWGLAGFGLILFGSWLATRRSAPVSPSIPASSPASY
ncbi:MAG: DMT family transporter [Gammaproteobacteria bacterium]|nr:DMT family transporter [Gammaproteobacteria bacterium]